MAGTKFQNVLEAVGQATSARAVNERLRTRALGKGRHPIVVFEIGEELFTLDLTRASGPWVSRTKHDDPGLRVITDEATLAQIWRREIVVWDAMEDGRLEMHGDFRLGHALQRFFDPDAEL